MENIQVIPRTDKFWVVITQIDDLELLFCPSRSLTELECRNKANRLTSHLINDCGVTEWRKLTNGVKKYLTMNNVSFTFRYRSENHG